MQKPKVGSVVILTKDLDVVLVKGTLGVICSVTEDSKSWGVKNLTVDFGGRDGKLLKCILEDMSFILPYAMPKKVKDTVAAKL